MSAILASEYQFLKEGLRDSSIRLVCQMIFAMLGMVGMLLVFWSVYWLRFILGF